MDIINRFFEELTKDLVKWASNANKALPSEYHRQTAASAASADFRIVLRSINSEINHLRNILGDYYITYKEYAAEERVAPLSVNVLTKYSAIVTKLEDATQRIADVANNYEEVFKNAPVEQVNKYITAQNQDAIVVLKNFTVEKLIELLRDADLAGF